MNLVRGDTGAFKFQRIDSSGNPITSVPDELYFTVKKSYTYSSAVLQKAMSDMTLDGEGVWHFVIAPEDTESLEYGTYVYDIEVTTGDYIKTIAKGRLKIEEEATWTANK